jgi:hypothetical protein
MTDQLDLLDPECVEKRDLVARERLPVVSAAGGLGRTEPTQIRGEHPELRRQPVKNPPPQFVGLGPAVEQQDWVPLARLEEVDAQATGVEETIGHLNWTGHNLGRGSASYAATARSGLTGRQQHLVRESYRAPVVGLVPDRVGDLLPGLFLDVLGLCLDNLGDGSDDLPDVDAELLG